MNVRLFTYGLYKGLITTPTPEPFCVLWPFIITVKPSELYIDSPVVEVSDKIVRAIFCSLMVLMILATFIGAAIPRTFKYAYLNVSLLGSLGASAFLTLAKHEGFFRISSLKSLAFFSLEERGGLEDEGDGNIAVNDETLKGSQCCLLE